MKKRVVDRIHRLGIWDDLPPAEVRADDHPMRVPDVGDHVDTESDNLGHDTAADRLVSGLDGDPARRIEAARPSLVPGSAPSAARHHQRHPVVVLVALVV